MWGRGVYYNVHRWYERGTGRYTRPDPIGLAGRLAFGADRPPRGLGGPMSGAAPSLPTAPTPAFGSDASTFGGSG
jgi:uncharacterized protein RhaS with RHS repeats